MAAKHPSEQTPGDKAVLKMDLSLPPAIAPCLSTKGLGLGETRTASEEDVGGEGARNALQFFFQF